MSEDDKIILAMCEAHDREEAAQIGEPSPWREDAGAGDPDWVQGRFFAMREAFDVARAALAAAPSTEVHAGGWRDVKTAVVPVEPTDEMLRVQLACDFPAMFREHLRYPGAGPDSAADQERMIAKARKRWSAMLAAAPAPLPGGLDGSFSPEGAKIPTETVVRGLRLIADHFAIQNPLQREYNVRGWPNMEATTSEVFSECAALAAEGLAATPDASQVGIGPLADEPKILNAHGRETAALSLTNGVGK